MKTSILYLYLILVSLFLSFDAISQKINTQDFNCFSILIGKEATIDGSVMLAHNEDDGGDRVVNWYKVPQKKHNVLTDSIQLKRGHIIPQTQNTYAYLWLQIPELEFSDSYMNEYGLVITSDNCPSRENQPELVNGGIGYWLRRLMVERTKTAREAVVLAGKLVETIGYAASGRSYCIADPNETWMLSVVQGKHWVAQRVPDNHIAIIPNYYTITQIDLSDTANFLGSKDLITYAMKRGWHDPKEGPFNFRKTYGNPDILESISNKARYWVSINALSKKQYTMDANFPFSFVPKKKLALQDVFKVLRNHYEAVDTDFLEISPTGNPHQQNVMSVCSNTNQYGFVAQLRSWMPSTIGAVLWIAPRRPCTQAFIPVYLGILATPKGYALYDETTALKNHFNKIYDFEAYTQTHAYMRFDKKAKEIDLDYDTLIIKQQKKRDKKEEILLENQYILEEKLLKIYSKNPKKAKKYLTKYMEKTLKDS